MTFEVSKLLDWLPLTKRLYPSFSLMSSNCLIAIIFVHLLLVSVLLRLNVLFMSKIFATVMVQDNIMIFGQLRQSAEKSNK